MRKLQSDSDSHQLPAARLVPTGCECVGSYEDEAERSVHAQTALGWIKIDL